MLLDAWVPLVHGIQEMRIFTFLSLITLVVRFNVQAASEGIVSYFASDGGYAYGTAGWTFQPLAPLSVTSLGCFDYILNSYSQTPMSIGLWAANGSLLASNSVTSTSPLVGQSRYEPITPVPLAVGLTYHIGAYYPSNGVTVLLAAVPEGGGSVTTSPLIQFGAAVQEPSGFGFPTPVTGGAGAAFLVPNFQFVAVPEPTSLAIGSFGLFILAGRRRR
jgi:hypothetical protein